MRYWIDGDKIRFEGEEVSGFFTEGSGSSYEADYIAWLAEGNEPEEWTGE